MLTSYFIYVYHRDEAHRGPYEDGQKLFLTVSYRWRFPERYNAPEIADWLYWQLNGLSSRHRTNAAGEFGFLAECVYRLMGYRPLETGDVIELATGDSRRFLAREDAGWRDIGKPPNLTGERLSIRKVNRYLHRRHSWLAAS